MSGKTNINFEAQMVQQATQLRYPATPDIAGRISGRLTGTPRRRGRNTLRFAWLAIVLLVIMMLFFVPPLRAAIIDFLQIGVVKIWRNEAVPIEETMPVVPPTPTALPLAGKTILEAAQAQIPWTVKLPTYPPDLGAPDAVYLQSLDGYALVLVWMDKTNPDKISLSLHMLESNVLVWKKVDVKIVQETTVNRQKAYWTTGPYLLEVQSTGVSETRLIEGHVLIWEEAGITHRLECNLTLEEAVKIAESLR